MDTNVATVTSLTLMAPLLHASRLRAQRGETDKATHSPSAGASAELQVEGLFHSAGRGHGKTTHSLEGLATMNVRTMSSQKLTPSMVRDSAVADISCERRETKRRRRLKRGQAERETQRETLGSARRRQRVRHLGAVLERDGGQRALEESQQRPREIEACGTGRTAVRERCRRGEKTKLR